MKIASEKKISLKELEQIKWNWKRWQSNKKGYPLYLKTKSAKGDSIPLLSEEKISVLCSRVEEMHHMRKMISKHMMQSISYVCTCLCND